MEQEYREALHSLAEISSANSTLIKWLSRSTRTRQGCMRFVLTRDSSNPVIRLEIDNLAFIKFVQFA